MAKKVESNEEININIDKIKDELNNHIDEKIKKEIDKNYKKLIRLKSKKILVKNIIIILLSIVVLYLLYLLKEADYFDKYFIDEKIESEVIVDKSKYDEKSIIEEELKDKYSYLLEKIVIDENSDYLNEYYNGNLSSELKKYLALNLLNIENFTYDDYILIENDILKEKYNELFEANYLESDFKYDNNLLKYISKLKIYMSDKLFTNKQTNIKREIINISQNNNSIYITTLEALVKDNRVYNIITHEKLGHYNKTLDEYKDKINKITYEFKNEKLVNIKTND